ncbi:hypothetical protein SAMN05216436_107120 [bacterium A37T11]|nr:hypothetical protein SAMN05216436_107120 [bacterium A37T11]
MSGESDKFRIIARKYRKHFTLSQDNITGLYNGKRGDYTGVESGKRTVDLDLAYKIAAVYGLTYCQMVNPDQAIPDLENLPLKTKQLISERMEKGVIEKNDELQLPVHVKTILDSGKLPEIFTSNQVYSLLERTIKRQITANRITVLLTKGSLRYLVEYAAEQPEDSNRPGRKNSVFRLKK